jgi:hypothetical protein
MRDEVELPDLLLERHPAEQILDLAGEVVVGRERGGERRERGEEREC